MITKIEIDGFKSFVGFSMELRPLTVVLGANAAGKSNLLDALHTFSQIIRLDLSEALRSNRGNGIELFSRENSGNYKQNFSININSPKDIFKTYVTRSNQTFVDRTHVNNKEMPNINNSLHAIDYFSEIKKIADIANSIHHIYPTHEMLRKASFDFDDPPLKPDGSNLAAALAALENVEISEGRTRLDALQEALARLVPGVQGVEVRHDEEVAEYRLSIITRDGTKLPARLASDGTLRMIALLAALHAPEGGTLCFEEPENGLHPGQLRALIELIVERTASDAQPPLQVIATSHSPVVLAALLEARRAAPEQIGLYFMSTARHIPEGATDPGQISTISRARRIGDEGESGRDVVPWREVERYLNTATLEEP